MKKKLYIVSLMMLIIINMFSICVSALGFAITMTPSNTKIEPGTEVSVSVKVSSLNVGDDGINTFSATLGYDAEVFEPLTDANVEGSNDWKAAYATGTGRITLTKTSFVNSDEEIMQITLKVKSDIESGTKGEITLSNILAANPEDEYSSSNISTTITVGDNSSSNQPSEQEPNNTDINNIINNNLNNGNTNNTTEDDNNNNSITDDDNDNNVSVITPIANNTNNTDNNMRNEIDQVEDDIPYTGSEETDFMKIIMGLIIIALLIYRKMYSLEDI